MTVMEQLLENNETYAAGFDKGGLPAPPARKLAIVTCMDARIHPEAALGIALGEAHVIRNAGGRIADALRSLAISQTLLGTEEVAIIHHTDCGMLTFSDEDIRAKLRERGADADHIAFLPFRDLDGSVRDDIALYKSSPIVRQDIPVHGYLYDVNTGRVTQVA
ncbi:MAG: carbonic anhydrase [Dehalococcoidia bacterium]